MKIKWGALVVDGRNKIGGQVASKNRAGSYLRNKVTPVNPQTTFQVSQRAKFSSFSQGWKSLTEANRLNWNNAVSDYKKTDIFGDIVNPSGFNLYVKLNTMLSITGGTAVTDPPAPVGVSVFSTLSTAAAKGAGTMTCTVLPATLPATEKIIIRATSGQSAGKSFVKSQFRQISVVTTVTAGSINIAAAYAAKFGAVPAAGQKVFVEIVHVNSTTGQVGQRQQAVAIVAA